MTLGLLYARHSAYLQRHDPTMVRNPIQSSVLHMKTLTGTTWVEI